MKLEDLVRWKKVSGKRLNQLEFLAMGDVVMKIVAKHPMLGGWWQVEGPDGHRTWVPADEIWVLNNFIS